MIGYKQMDSFSVKAQPWTWLIMRVLASLMFITHGYAKLFGSMQQPVTGGMDFFGLSIFGLNMLFVAGVIEFFGGILVLVGLLTRTAAGLSALLALMAYLSAHMAWFPTMKGGELAAMYFLVFIVIAAYGPGKFALDNVWCKWDSKRKKAAKKK